MDELIKAFHLDWKILIAQIVNFSIVFFLFYKLAYRPLLAKMNQRTNKIEKGLKDAVQSAKLLEESDKEREERILTAKKEAGEILEKSRLLAEKNRKGLAEKAQMESRKIIEDAKAQIVGEKEKVIGEIRKEIAGLIEASLMKVLQEKSLQENDKALIEKSIGEINQKVD